MKRVYKKLDMILRDVSDDYTKTDGDCFFIIACAHESLVDYKSVIELDECKEMLNELIIDSKGDYKKWHFVEAAKKFLCFVDLFINLERISV